MNSSIYIFIWKIANVEKYTQIANWPWPNQELIALKVICYNIYVLNKCQIIYVPTYWHSISFETNAHNKLKLKLNVGIEYLHKNAYIHIRLIRRWAELDIFYQSPEMASKTTRETKERLLRIKFENYKIKSGTVATKK